MTHKLAIVVAATKSYLHAWRACVRAVSTAAAHYPDAHFIFATDQSDEAKAAAKILSEELPEGWKITVLPLPISEDAKDYQHAAQLRIAALQGSAFAFARSKLRADLLWCVESDNIVPADALRVLEWTLAMPTADGSPLYHVAAATYWNGQFLGGFGTHRSPINPDFLPGERKLKPRLKQCMDACEARLKVKPDSREIARMKRLSDRVVKCPPDGNLWEVIQKHGYRRRGWMDHAYPGIGAGAVVPTDWVGLGCTLMGKRALQLADFCGYDGGGTQDLYLCWHRWYPAGLRLAIVPHIVCDHIKRGADAITHHIGYHELDGECEGHLRVRSVPWVDAGCHSTPL